MKNLALLVMGFAIVSLPVTAQADDKDKSQKSSSIKRSRIILVDQNGKTQVIELGDKKEGPSAKLKNYGISDADMAALRKALEGKGMSETIVRRILLSRSQQQETQSATVRRQIKVLRDRELAGRKKAEAAAAKSRDQVQAKERQAKERAARVRIVAQRQAQLKQLQDQVAKSRAAAMAAAERAAKSLAVAKQRAMEQVDKQQKASSDAKAKSKKKAGKGKRKKNKKKKGKKRKGRKRKGGKRKGKKKRK